MADFEGLKHQAYEGNIELFRRGLVTYSFGNASAADREAGVFAIKPSGIEYKVLRPDDIVVLSLKGEVLEGDLNPSSDTKTHLVLYNAFPCIGGVVHTHSTYASAWAQSAQPIPLLGTTHADHLPRDVPCSDFLTDEQINGDYEVETGLQIVRTVKGMSYQEVEMVLVAGHAPFTWGKTLKDAVHNSIMLEEIAKMAYLSLQINPQAGRLKEPLIRKHYQRKHGPDRYYGQK